MSDNERALSRATLARMPGYLRHLKRLEEEGVEYISSVGLADALQENAAVVKKDLSMAITCEGKPKVGYYIPELIRDIERFMGYDNLKDAVLVGVGKLGQALMGYGGFEAYGLNIIAGFDIDDRVIGREINGKKILHAAKLESTVEKLNIKLAVIATPAEHAQPMADLLVRAGIRAIWNFAPLNLNLPDSVAVKNENMAASLAILSSRLNEILSKDDLGDRHGN